MRRRSRARAYLLLARVSNLPTVWTNVLAAYVVAGASRESLAVASIALSLFYVAGMFLNDAFDAAFDAAVRADRPIPAGDVSRTEVFAVGAALMAAGALMWGAALGAAILFYDYQHKGRSFGPVVMGACRALVYATAAAGATGRVSAAVATSAVVMWIYIIVLTRVAKTPGYGSTVPYLLAGICVVDAAMIAAAGAPQLAMVAATGYITTLAFQRVVPGT
jgi:4-hydroxybenzoate polyprenyltransferase